MVTSPGFPRRRRFPDVIIAGVAKCGTAALLQLLADHPGVERTELKEVHFFDRSPRGGARLGWYLDQFPEVAEGTLVAEKTPAYFGTPGAAEEIQKVA